MQRVKLRAEHYGKLADKLRSNDTIVVSRGTRVRNLASLKLCVLVGLQDLIQKLHTIRAVSL